MRGAMRTCRPRRNPEVALANAGIPFRFPVGEVIQEELTARGWTTQDFAERMGTHAEIPLNMLAVDTLIAVPESRIDQQMADELGRAFGVSGQFFMRLQEAYFALDEVAMSDAPHLDGGFN